jgi:DNA-binding IclR family transcriptional regulator
MLPSLVAAAKDPKVEPASAKVLMYLAADVLTDDEFWPVKVSSVAKALHMEDRRVGRALNKLVALGYLRRGGTNRVRTYRLVYRARAA